MEEEIIEELETESIDEEIIEEAGIDEEVEESEESESEQEEEETAEIDLDEEVEYEGKQYKVPKELKEALLRQSDYTRKTQDLAEQRGQMDTQRQQAEQAIQSVTQFQQQFAELSNMDSQLQQLGELDWNAAINENPVEAMKLQARFNELRVAREQKAGEIGQLQQNVEQQRQAEMQRQIQQGETVLKESIPGWNQEMKVKVVEYGKSIGFTNRELSTITDPRMIQVLNKARMVDESTKKLSKRTTSKTVKPTKTVKSSKSTQKGLNDNLSDKEWLTRRNAELKKAGRR